MVNSLNIIIINTKLKVVVIHTYKSKLEDWNSVPIISKTAEIVILVGEKNVLVDWIEVGNIVYEVSKIEEDFIFERIELIYLVEIEEEIERATKVVGLNSKAKVEVKIILLKTLVAIVYLNDLLFVLYIKDVFTKIERIGIRIVEDIFHTL